MLQSLRAWCAIGLFATAAFSKGREAAELDRLKVELRRIVSGRTITVAVEGDVLDVLDRVARLKSAAGLAFMGELVRRPRYARLREKILTLMMRQEKDATLLRTLLEERLAHNDPFRVPARTWLIDHAERQTDEAFFRKLFRNGVTEDRFLALRSLGRMGSRATLPNAWALLRDEKWQPDRRVGMHGGTIAAALRDFEGTEAARLLLLLQRDRRFDEKDAEQLREATRLWRHRDLLGYVRMSDLADPAPDKRAATARFFGVAGIERARQPLLRLARNRTETGQVRAAAAEALGGLSIARGHLAAQLAVLARDRDRLVREGAIRGLAGLRVRQAARALVALLGTSQERAARAALAVLADLPASHDWPRWLKTDALRLPRGT